MNCAFGAATAGIDYTNTKFEDANGTTGSVTFSSYEVWGQYKVTPAATLGAAYAYTDGKVNYNGTKPKFHQVSLMGSYSLSKRTSFYAIAGLQQAAGGAKQADIFDFSIADASTTKRQLMFPPRDASPILEPTLHCTVRSATSSISEVFDKRTVFR